MVVETHLEVKIPSKGQDLPLVYVKKESSNLGHFVSQILSWAREVPFVQIRRGIN